jgi:hypothetical protein
VRAAVVKITVCGHSSDEPRADDHRLLSPMAAAPATQVIAKER